MRDTNVTLYERSINGEGSKVVLAVIKVYTNKGFHGFNYMMCFAKLNLRGILNLIVAKGEFFMCKDTNERKRNSYVAYDI